jgi:hypothetical protein
MKELKERQHFRIVSVTEALSGMEVFPPVNNVAKGMKT